MPSITFLRMKWKCWMLRSDRGWDWRGEGMKRRMIGGTGRWGDYWSSSVLYYHTHAPHTTTSLNNASHRRDSAAAVATRERCGRVETAGGGLWEDWSEPDRVLMSFLSLSVSGLSIHPLISIGLLPSSINTAYEQCTRQCWLISLVLFFFICTIPLFIIFSLKPPVCFLFCC